MYVCVAAEYLQGSAHPEQVPGHVALGGALVAAPPPLALAVVALAQHGEARAALERQLVAARRAVREHREHLPAVHDAELLLDTW